MDQPRTREIAKDAVEQVDTATNEAVQRVGPELQSTPTKPTIFAPSGAIAPMSTGRCCGSMPGTVSSHGSGADPRPPTRQRLRGGPGGEMHMDRNMEALVPSPSGYTLIRQVRDGGIRPRGVNRRHRVQETTSDALSFRLPCQFASAGHLWVGRGASQPVKAVGERKDGSLCAGVIQLSGDLSCLLGAVEPLQGFIQERWHVILPCLSEAGCCFGSGTPSLQAWPGPRQKERPTTQDGPVG
jgi:hypothetical protein